MKIKNAIDGEGIDYLVDNILQKMHSEWPLDQSSLETLSYIKKFHPDIFSKYESRLIYLMGLFYKTSKPESFIEEIYSIIADGIKEECGWKNFTPFQWSAYREIKEKCFFSFSAPTSAGKSYLFRELILETDGDIIIMVPSRALIAEYMYKVGEIVSDHKEVLVLPFIDNINIKHTDRKIFIITPERWIELFKLKDQLNIKLFLFDEAQISEGKIRWMQFDTFVRRSNEFFPEAKKVFAHPFINNPEAQLQKHNFPKSSTGSENYKQLSVWKIYLSYLGWEFSFFSPFNPIKNTELIPADFDIIEETLSKGWTILMYVSKISIYTDEYISKYKKYIDLCPAITDQWALAHIDRLREFIGASPSEQNKHSTMIDMMEKWVVIHHGSIPLKARYIIEDFINQWYAKICFSTATLLQWINMPFDVVWVDNFRFQWSTKSDDEKTLSLKNLIWRAWRNNIKNKSQFDYWYVIIEEKNRKKFSERIKNTVNISPISKLDEDISDIIEDNKDIYEAFRGGWFNDSLYLPNNQIQRISEGDIDKDILMILDNLLSEGLPIKWVDYNSLGDKIRNEIKESFKKIYKSHMRRRRLETWEQSVLSTSIPMLLWRIQWKTFKEIVWLRHSYITKKDEQREIATRQKTGDNTRSINDITLHFSQQAETLPNAGLKNLYSLFPNGSKLRNFKYDVLVYDTYDYLDKVFTFSIVNPIWAAFNIYYKKTKDERALIMENYIRYWTNDAKEIMLLRYWFSFEEIEWLKDYVEKIDENEIVFKNNIYELNSEQMSRISRYM